MIDRRLGALEGIRALAALSVVVHHAGANTLGAPDSFVVELVSRLDVGVSIFFVLSGFLITRPFVHADLEGAPRPTLGTFLRNRAVRIIPAYWVALVALGLLGWIRFDGNPLVYPLFLQVYRRETFLQGITVAWSLCVEVAFYALVPLLALAVRRMAAGDPGRARRAWLGAVAALVGTAVVFRGAVGILDPSWEAISFGWLPTHLDAFALGILVAVLEAGGRRSPGSPMWWWAGAAALFVAFVAISPPPPGFNEEAVYPDWVASLRGPVFALIGVALLIPPVLGRWSPKWLAAGAAAWVGSLSYALYLWHLDLIRADVRRAEYWGWVVSFPWALLAGVGGGLAIAWLSRVLVERPAMRLRRG